MRPQESPFDRGKFSRAAISAIVAKRLIAESETLAAEWLEPGRISTVLIDGLLPAELANALVARMPSAELLSTRHTLAEHKLVSAQLDRFDSAVEEIVFAFQQPEVLAQLKQITGLSSIEADPELYAGGISLMLPGHYLRPHLDNSHDRLRQRYRVLNLLYYLSDTGVSGGELELYDRGPKHAPRTIASQHNRLVIIATHRESLHGVSPVTLGARWCVSNYYFTTDSPDQSAYFHVTSFRGRVALGGAKEVVADAALRASAILRMGLRRLFPKGIFPVWHRYRRDPTQKPL
jgi:Rps23 Pro-64 3,4-dihydroxylase Tpa1-like proline 4-hydroxylase